MGTPWAFMTQEQREKKLALDRARRAANPEKSRAAVRAWNAANPDKARARFRAYKESKRRARMTLALLAIGGTR
jgi:hypothetical protein